MDNVNLVQVIFDRSAQNPDEDSAIFTIHIRGIVSGLPDQLGSIANDDRAAYAAAVNTFWDNIQGYVSTKVNLVAVKFYEMGDDPDDQMGPPVQVVNGTNLGGSSAQVLPPQMASSVTLKHPSTGGVGKTGSRWGRIYVPGVTVAALDANGRFNDTYITLLVGSAQALWQPVNGANGVRGTIWSRKLWQHFDPSSLQVDDVPDVIRSRRFSTTHLRRTAAVS